MAWIKYVQESEVPAGQRVNDPDNIIQIHRVHPAVMKQHFELYARLMRRPGPLTFVQRELIAVVASSINQCRY